MRVGASVGTAGLGSTGVRVIEISIPSPAWLIVAGDANSHRKHGYILSGLKLGLQKIRARSIKPAWTGFILRRIVTVTANLIVNWAEATESWPH